MRIPAKHSAATIKNHENTVYIESSWELARPEPYFSWKKRWQLAWLVFTGKADALVWKNQ